MPSASEDNDRCYYDSCLLDGRIAYKEITTRDRANGSLISHLCLGEAYGNMIKHGPDAVEAFVELINDLKKFIRIVGNDGTKEIFKAILDKFPRLEVADAMHLATAIKNRCGTLKTADGDLYGLDAAKIKSLGENFGLEAFRVKKMDRR